MVVVVRLVRRLSFIFKKLRIFWNFFLFMLARVRARRISSVLVGGFLESFDWPEYALGMSTFVV